MRLGIPIIPKICCKKKVKLNPKTNNQKCHLPNEVDNILPLILGNQ